MALPLDNCSIDLIFSRWLTRIWLSAVNDVMSVCKVFMMDQVNGYCTH